MPYIITELLFRTALVLLLLAVMVALLLYPARDVLIPLWPWTVDEVILAHPVDSAGQREFVSRLDEVNSSRVLITRDRPMMLVALESPAGEIGYGFLVGVRSEPEGRLLEMIPDNLVGIRRNQHNPSDLVLVIMRADETRAELTLDEVHRLYHPNRLSLIDRFSLTGQRLVEAWRPPQVISSS